MKTFLVQGYLILPSSRPKEFHSKIYKQLNKKDMMKDNPGNNVVPQYSDLKQVLQCPVIKGGLTSILGRNYVFHPHRHRHGTIPGTKDQQIHRDSFFGYMNYRSHRPRWCMVMYFPQDTPEEMGPTCIIPRSQYNTPDDGRKGNMKIPTSWNSHELISKKIKAGSLVFIHYDLWHRGVKNTSKFNRFMLKFQFYRTQEPTKPTWNAKKFKWECGKSPTHLTAIVWDIWK
eukprot:UN29426